MIIYAAVIVGFCTCICSFIAVAGRIDRCISYDIRQTCFDKLQRLPYSYYDRKAVGWLMARMTSDCSNLSRVMAWATLDLAWELLRWGRDCADDAPAWRLALVVIAIAPMLIIVSRYFQVRLLKTSRALRKANSQTTAAFNEGIVGRENDQIDGARRKKRPGVFASHARHVRPRRAKRHLRIDVLADDAFDLRTRYGAGVRFGGIGVIHGTMTLGALATFLQIVFFIQFPVQELTNAITQIQARRHPPSGYRACSMPMSRSKIRPQ